MAETAENVIERVVGEHVRGDWSDRTYSCLGCRLRREDELEAQGAPLNRAEHNDFMTRFVHPRWSLDDYNAHVAAEVATALRGAGVLRGEGS